MQHPHRRWEGCRGDPWVNGCPELERARGQEPAEKAENREKTPKLLRGATRVTWRKLDGLQSNAQRSMAGLWRRRLTARWTRRSGQRTAWATSAGPAPRHACGQGMHGPPPSRSDVRQECTAGWPQRRASQGHRVLVGVRDGESPSQGKGAQVEYESRGRGCEARGPEAAHRAHWRAV
jgi:hypothetical protein